MKQSIHKIQLIIALFCGLVFGLGLHISEMANPNKVINFLDVFGSWDPSLIFVMGAGLTVFSLAFFLLIKRREKPIFGQYFFIPERKLIDKNLVIGAICFGIGWGLIGICPGPAIASVLTLNPKIFVFICSMLVGMFCANQFIKYKAAQINALKVAIERS